MTLLEKINANNALKIGFGPGGCGYTAKMQKRRKGISLFCYRVVNKFFVRPIQKYNYVKNVTSAFKAGFRLVDFSAAYNNENLIKKAIKKSGIPREEFFITTRVSNKAQKNKTIREEFFNSLKGFGVDYVDLYQFHWPVTGLFLDTWKEMEKLYEEGYVKHLGVANCNIHHIEEILKICKHKPELNQIEIHPLFTQKKLIDYCKTQNIVVEAYTPVARYDDRLVRLPLLKELEKKYKKTFIQIILRWHIQNGVIPVVRTLNYKHQLENISIFDFEITQDDMKLIDSININSRLRYDPDNCDFSIL